MRFRLHHVALTAGLCCLLPGSLLAQRYPPTGDLTVAQARELLGRSVVAIKGLPIKSIRALYGHRLVVEQVLEDGSVIQFTVDSGEWGRPTSYGWVSTVRDIERGERSSTERLMDSRRRTRSFAGVTVVWMSSRHSDLLDQLEVISN